MMRWRLEVLYCAYRSVNLLSGYIVALGDYLLRLGKRLMDWSAIRILWALADYGPDRDADA